MVPRVVINHSKQFSNKWLRRRSIRWLSNGDEVSTYLRSLQIPKDLDDGIMRALHSVYGKNIDISHLKQLGRSGLHALAESVKKEQSPLTTSGQVRPVEVSIPHHRTSFSLNWREGQNLLDLSKENPDLLGEYMEGTCGGTMSCCTCHVYLDKTTYELAGGSPSEAEQDMLDLAFDPQPSSRLGCQVNLTPDLLDSQHSVVVTIPAGVHDVWK